MIVYGVWCSTAVEEPLLHFYFTLEDAKRSAYEEADESYQDFLLINGDEPETSTQTSIAPKSAEFLYSHTIQTTTFAVKQHQVKGSVLALLAAQAKEPE